MRAILCIVAFVGALVPRLAGALDSKQLAVVANTLDPMSMEISEYYAKRRGIPFQNIIRVSFVPGRTVMPREEFDRIKARVDGEALPHVQAYAITWASPYRVECMSITAAFAFGFDEDFCADGCKPTRPSAYYNSRVRQPFTQLGMRPTMAIAAMSFRHAKELIDRGVQSDGSQPSGAVYLLSTSDKARDVRSESYHEVERLLGNRIRVRRLTQDALEGKADVLFYFTGRDRVEGLDTLRFLPGAIADHLTSTGGMLTDSDQMSALRWLEAGATGSYGAVTEPCNLPQKFPKPAVAIAAYLRGDTLIEAYWKSVKMPGQGIFIGEPLAVPYWRHDKRQERYDGARRAADTVASESP
jgi:uncharacterized protein (TIGR03790 family)